MILLSLGCLDEIDAMIKSEAMNAATENKMIAKRLKERIDCAPNCVLPG
jgi:hypothetical protein